MTDPTQQPPVAADVDFLLLPQLVADTVAKRFVGIGLEATAQVRIIPIENTVYVCDRNLEPIRW